MRRSTAFVVAVSVATGLGLTGCSWLGFGDDEEVTVEQEQAGPAFEPVESVRDIEIGRTRDGFVITAFGVAPGLGYSQPQLRPRRQGGVGPDGYLDYDLIARAPDPGFNLGTGSATARTVRADLQVTLGELQGARGIRVHAVEGGLLVNF